MLRFEWWCGWDPVRALLAGRKQKEPGEDASVCASVYASCVQD